MEMGKPNRRKRSTGGTENGAGIAGTTGGEEGPSGNVSILCFFLMNNI